MKHAAPSCQMALVLLTVVSTHACADAALHCQVRYASETIHIKVRPVANPYAVSAQDIGQRFRFKAVMVGTDVHVDHVALYAYDMEMPGAPLLIHQVVHHPPFSGNSKVPGLTGWNHVYSARLGREMVYGCALSQGAS
jgi:hypothetical protein